jgi:hypothetical protein
MLAAQDATLCAGSAMAVLPTSSDTLYIWHTANKAAEKVSLGAHLHQQELTAACWAADGVQLAIGASKGTVIIFDTGLNRIKHNLQGVHERVRLVQAVFSVAQHAACAACAALLWRQPASHKPSRARA